VLRALCLGAKGVYIGRPFLYGLGAGGRDGVKLALDIIRNELDITMALCGKRDIAEAGPDLLHAPDNPFGTGHGGTGHVGTGRGGQFRSATP
jgi:L-lactate dehydrogenase (cytochrome)